MNDYDDLSADQARELWSIGDQIRAAHPTMASVQVMLEAAYKMGQQHERERLGRLPHPWGALLVPGLTRALAGLAEGRDPQELLRELAEHEQSCPPHAWHRNGLTWKGQKAYWDESCQTCGEARLVPLARGVEGEVRG